MSLIVCDDEPKVTFRIKNTDTREYLPKNYMLSSVALNRARKLNATTGVSRTVYLVYDSYGNYINWYR